MSKMHYYRGCEIEVRASQYTWGAQQGKWHGSFTILRTPDGESHAMSGVMLGGVEPETEIEAREHALYLAIRWIDQTWFNGAPH